MHNFMGSQIAQFMEAVNKSLIGRVCGEFNEEQLVLMSEVDRGIRWGLNILSRYINMILEKQNRAVQNRMLNGCPVPIFCEGSVCCL